MMITMIMTIIRSEDVREDTETAVVFPVGAAFPAVVVRRAVGDF